MVTEGATRSNEALKQTREGQKQKEARLLYPSAFSSPQRNLSFQETCFPGEGAVGCGAMLVIKFLEALIGPLL